MGKAAAHGAAISDLGVGDKRHGLDEKGSRFEHRWVPFETSLASHGADAQRAAIRPANKIELGDAVHVDQQRRFGEAEVEQRNQALAARQDLGVMAVVGESTKNSFEGVGSGVVERSGLQAKPLPADWPTTSSPRPLCGRPRRECRAAPRG